MLKLARSPAYVLGCLLVVLAALKVPVIHLISLTELAVGLAELGLGLGLCQRPDSRLLTATSAIFLLVLVVVSAWEVANPTQSACHCFGRLIVGEEAAFSRLATAAALLTISLVARALARAR
ncbi:MAG: hypothetical protein ACI90M_002789 [Candidatus Azotimanducaceae bacterium]|jgi:hypothetical protein